MARHALLDPPAPAAPPAADITAVLTGLPTIVRWPTIDPDEAPTAPTPVVREAREARRALHAHRPPSLSLLRRVLAGLYAL